MTPASEAASTVPSKLAIDNIAETLAALHDELRSLLSAPVGRSQGVIIIDRVPAEVWHALEGRTLSSTAYIWKNISTTTNSRLSVFCEHDTECPDHPGPTESGADS